MGRVVSSPAILSGVSTLYRHSAWCIPAPSPEQIHNCIFLEFTLDNEELVCYASKPSERVRYPHGFSVAAPPVLDALGKRVTRR